MSELMFVNWEGRPAVISGSRAWAVLAKGEGWSKVNSSEVAESGRVSSGEEIGTVFGSWMRDAGGWVSLEKLIAAAVTQAAPG
jgi:hypothetical protein